MSCTTRASWSGSPKRRCPRPLQVKTRAASPVGVGEHRPQVLVGGHGVAHLELDGRAHLHAIADGQGPLEPIRAHDAADEEVAALERRPVLVDGDAELQPRGQERSFLGVGGPRPGRRVGRARDARRSPSARLPSARVTIIGSPMGRHPCETTVRVATPPGRTTPTPPEDITSSSRTRRLPPGVLAAEAIPPTTGTDSVSLASGISNAASASMMASTGSEKGSARSSSASPGSNVEADRPWSAMPEAVRVAWRRTGRGRTARRPAHRPIAGASSTSRLPPRTATAVVPTNTRGRSMRLIAAAMSPKASTMLGRREHGRDVGLGAEPFQYRPDDLAGGLGGIGVLRQGAGERHVILMRAPDPARRPACRARR